MALTGTVAEATATVPKPLRNERRLISDWDDSLWGRSLMPCVISHADKRGRSKSGQGRRAFAEMTFENIVLPVINPLQGQRRFAHDRLAGYTNRVRIESRTRSIPEGFAATDQSAWRKWRGLNLQEVPSGERDRIVRVRKTHWHCSHLQFRAAELSICGGEPIEQRRGFSP